MTPASPLTFDRDPITRGPTVEVAHEALVRNWPRLRDDWIEKERENLPLTRSARWYSTPSDNFSALRSPLSVKVPSFTSKLKSSFFIPGSSARIK